MRNRGFKAFLALFVVFGLSSMAFADMCPIPKDIEDKYHKAIKAAKETKSHSADRIGEYKKITLNDYDNRSYWDSLKWKTDEKFKEDCEKKEKYYRQALAELIEKYKNHRVYNKEYFNGINGEAEVQIKARELRKYDEL